jgi:hypothetical protein
MTNRPLIVDLKGLKKLGWPLSRAHTSRMMYDPDYGDNRFPACRKLGAHRNSHPVASAQPDPHFFCEGTVKGLSNHKGLMI